eukprot:scaffold627_cov144-Skeletonema_menzelii.AAC.41
MSDECKPCNGDSLGAAGAKTRAGRAGRAAPRNTYPPSKVPIHQIKSSDRSTIYIPLCNEGRRRSNSSRLALSLFLNHHLGQNKAKHRCIINDNRGKHCFYIKF